MKKSKNNSKHGLFILFLKIFSILFFGMSFCNICAITIDSIFSGFAVYLWRIVELPYLPCFICSFIISLIIVIIIHKATKE